MSARDAITKRIDLGLAVLDSIVPPRTVVSRQVIMEVCECSHGAVMKMEGKALANLRQMVERELNRREQ